MPSKYVVKDYAPDAYYHIFNRGVAKDAIFLDDLDYNYFINLLKRYLSNQTTQDKQGRSYPNYSQKIELLAYCLIQNHFHLFVYQHDSDAMTKLMSSLSTGYTMYFNRKYQRVGHLFQSRFKASMVSSDAYLLHLSRYIHMNPKRYSSWQFSSLKYYSSRATKEDWIKPGRILDLLESDNYLEFLSIYEANKQLLRAIKQEVAAG